MHLVSKHARGATGQTDQRPCRRTILRRRHHHSVVSSHASSKSRGETVIGWPLALSSWASWRSSKDAQRPDANPLKLLPSGSTLLEGGHHALSAAGPLTVYSLRLTTSAAPQASLSDPMSAVTVLLRGADGRSVMHRISPVNDPRQSVEQMHMICQLVDDTAGADCSMVVQPSAPSSSTQPHLPSGSSAAPKLRFQQGQVDEVSFLAPELGPLSAALVGTESGSWLLDEMDVSSSRTAHTDRFVCRVLLGSQPGHGAEWLLPVPPGAFVYGSGEGAVVLTKEHAESTLWSMSLSQPQVQAHLLFTTLLLAAGGTVVVELAAGGDAALPFALGGIGGLTYQWLDVKLLLGRLWGSGWSSGVAKAAESWGTGQASGRVPHSVPVGAPHAGAQATGGRGSSGASPAARLAPEAQPVAMRPLTQLAASGQGAPASGAGSPEAAAAASRALRQMASSPALRLGVATLVLATSALHGQGPEPVLRELQAVAQEEAGLLPSPSWEVLGQGAVEAAWKLMLGVLGFATCKVASMEVQQSMSDDADEPTLASGSMNKADS